MTDVYIYDAIRTPRGRGKAGKGGLANHHPQELLAQTLNTLAERKKLDKRLVDDLAVGCVTQVKEQGACIARVALIAAQWPDDVTGFTINRFCGSGLEAVNSIAAKIGAGFIDAGLGGGVESMSRVPMGSDGAMLDGNNEKLRKRLFLVPQGISADLIATREGFSRTGRRHVRARTASRRRRARLRRSGSTSRCSRSPTTTARSRSRRTSTRAPTPRSRASRSSSRRSPRWARRRWGRTARRSTRSRSSATRTPKRSSTSTPRGNSSGIVDGAALVLLGSSEWGKKARPQAARPHPLDGDHRRRAGDHADGAGSGVAEGAQEGGHVGQGHRSLGDQRGVRDRADADREGARDRSRSGST